MPRDYKKEYRDYHGKPKQKKKRASRNKARSIMSRAGRVHKGDGKDIDHLNGNALDNSPSNLSIMAASRNRSKK